ncbi:metallophosphoesterase [Breznakiella homolactica]|uniref:Metallophosphoesterase n=1 Tax=Breznakiella homolactica TaxID=2798577 RepID=A0A7T7XPQ4_9SPIR|nr:metallophosphoesterase [Breznakiella homolactica]QQO10117.1 metallophosphoesterase [Breznakiella homolactica]
MADNRTFRGRPVQWRYFFQYIYFCWLLAAASAVFAAGVPETGDGVFLPDIRIYVTNDIHYLAQSLHDSGPLFRRMSGEGDGKNLEAVDPVLRALAFSMENDPPDILLLNGDLTYNGERESHRELAQYLSRIESFGTKVFVIPGNHDIANPWARAFFRDNAYRTDSVTSKEFAGIYDEFGYGEALSRDRDTLSYVAEPFPGLRLLMIDTNKYSRNTQLGIPQADGAVPASTRKWIRRAAESAKRDGAVLVTSMHHSLMDHHPMVNQGFTVDDSRTLAELFSGLGINFVLTGHIHAQDISQYAAPSGVVYDIATSALSVYPHQHGVLQFVPEKSGWQYSVQSVDVEHWAAATGRQEETLLNFSRNAEDFFKKRSEGMVRRRGPDGVLTQEQFDAVVETVGTLNARYFAGTEYLNAGDIFQSPGYRIIDEYRLDFLADYLRFIMEDTPPCNIDLFIPLR